MESVLIDNNGIVEELTNTIEAKLLNDSPLPASCCIFRVPNKIRRKKVQAYEPDIVSIGPFHSGRRGNQFQLMENVKRWYLQCLLSHANITLASLIKGVVDFDKCPRNCYAEPFDHLNEKDFVEMMVLDGCFLIELFRKRFSVDQRDENDPVFNVSCMLEYLYHDVLLLENQLPWFVLERLYNLTAVKNTTCEGDAPSLTDLVLTFCRQSVTDDRIFNSSMNLPSKILNILDLIRSVIVAPFEDLGSQKKEEDEQRVPNVTSPKPALNFEKVPKPRFA
ncbi:hypothetical protein ACFX2I_044762 [Malus domestica]|nr:UPF0481 protein At3g47200-like [Malus domestica]